MNIYLNTDLDLIGEISFDAVMQGFNHSAEVLHYAQDKRGQWQAVVEAAGSGHAETRGQEKDIILLLAVIDAFDGCQQSEWDGLTVIDFNIGWQASKTRPVGRWELSTGVLASIARVGGKLSSTIYPPEE